MTYRLWNQERECGGQEFNLVCHIQEYLRDQRRNPTTGPFQSTKSTDSTIIGCMWVEVNSRVNYPTKNALGQYATYGLIDMMQDRTKFVVSCLLSCCKLVGLHLLKLGIIIRFPKKEDQLI